MVTINQANDSDIRRDDGQFRIPKEAMSKLHHLASSWTDVNDCKDLKLDQLSGAMTNQVYQASWPAISVDGESGKDRKVLLRIYGTGVDQFFDREVEIKTFEYISAQRQGPKLLDRFSNGRIEEFLDAKTLTAQDMRDPEISMLIATKLRDFHNLDVPGTKTVHLWERLRDWLGKAIDKCSAEEFAEFQLDKMKDEITALEHELPIEKQRMCFCHNDLQYGNIMIVEDTRLVTLIDYEYASYNPIAYDLANHFCEMAANYHTETPHLLDFSKYPELEERKRFVQTYLSASGEKSDDTEVEGLLQDIEKYSLASHLLWGLWGIISAKTNEIEFDFMEYARQRFHQYWSKKATIA